MDIFKLKINESDRQEQTVNSFGVNLKITLYYNRVANSWDMDLFDIDKDSYITQRKGLSTLSPALIERGLPFVVTLYPKDGKGIQPQSKAHLIDNFDIYFLSKIDFFKLI